MKSILITGASKGIGYHTAVELANRGHRVIAVSRSEKALTNLTEQTMPGSIIPIPIDITQSNDLKLLKEKISELPTLDGIINNAGLLINAPFFQSDIEQWRKQFEVNVFAPVQLIQVLKPFLKRGSHIVNIGSMGGYQGSAKFPGLSAYSASKGALAILSECLNTELAPKGITVNCLALGAVQTEMLEQAFPGYEAPVTSEKMANYIAEFTLTAHHLISGKILPVALNDPG